MDTTSLDTSSLSNIHTGQDSLLKQAKRLQTYVLSGASSPYSVSTTSAAGRTKRAVFATLSRLLTCLVNERIVSAYYVEYGNSVASSYLVFVPSNTTINGIYASCFALSQVCHKPVLASPSVDGCDSIHQVLLLDPEDLGICQWVQQADSAACPALVTSPSQIMEIVGKWNSYEADKIQAICAELDSSIENQTCAYKNRRPDPDILASTATEWEQSIIEGHATHPMYRARYAIPPLSPISPETDLFQPRLGFVAVPRDRLRVEGNFEDILLPLYSSADYDLHRDTSKICGDRGNEDGSPYILDYVNRSEQVVMPVHPLHMPAVLELFPFAQQLPFSVAAEAQASLRTVCPEALAPFGYNLKLPLGIKVSSALRTISPWSTFVGPRITEVIPEILQRASVPDALLIAGEPASAVSNDIDFDVAKYLSCVIRNDPEYICRARGERVILAAALTGYSDSGTSVVVRQWKLDTYEKRRLFLQNYTDKLFDAFLPPIVNHGFAFESHPQNSLLRIDAATGEIKGFIVRDFGGVKVHRETFARSTGKTIDMLPDSCTDAAVMYEVYDLAYHTLVQCQLHRLVRALDLHYYGSGWAVVRESFENRVPETHPLRLAWYQATFDLKCFITMKLDGLYRDYIYKKVPNVLFYAGEEHGVVYSPSIAASAAACVSTAGDLS